MEKRVEISIERSNEERKEKAEKMRGRSGKKGGDKQREEKRGKERKGRKMRGRSGKKGGDEQREEKRGKEGKGKKMKVEKWRGRRDRKHGHTHDYISSVGVGRSSNASETTFWLIFQLFDLPIG